MDTFFGEIFFSFIGRIYLWLKYRNKEKIKSVLVNEYNDRYFVAGSMNCYKLFGIIFLLLIATFLIVSVFSILKFGISDQ